MSYWRVTCPDLVGGSYFEGKQYATLEDCGKATDGLGYPFGTCCEFVDTNMQTQPPTTEQLIDKGIDLKTLLIVLIAFILLLRS